MSDNLSIFQVGSILVTVSETLDEPTSPGKTNYIAIKGELFQNLKVRINFSKL